MNPALVLALGLLAPGPSPAAAPAPGRPEPAAARRATHSDRRPAASARASSFRRWTGAGHEPKRVIDGDGATAWCEGVPGIGVGEWVEVRPRCHHGQGVCSLIIENGWGRDADTYRLNGRATRIRVSACAGATEGQVVEVKDVPEPQELKLLAPLPAPACVRLTLLAATTSKTQDTCISEVSAACTCEAPPGR